MLSYYFSWLSIIPMIVLNYLQAEPSQRLKKAKENDPRTRDLCRALPRLPPSSLRSNWSCNWESWKEKYMFRIQPDYHSLSYADMTMACIYNLPVPIRPIAYNKGSNDHAYIFVAGGSYYYYLPGPEQLVKLEGEGLRDDNILRVGWAKQTMVDEVEDGSEKLNNLEMEQKEKAWGVITTD